MCPHTSIYNNFQVAYNLLLDARKTPDSLPLHIKQVCVGVCVCVCVCVCLCVFVWVCERMCGCMQESAQRPEDLCVCVCVCERERERERER
jgi:hypothetical protein